MWTKLRTVVLQPKTALAVDQFTKDFHRFDEAFEGLSWFLVRNPDVGFGQNIDGREYRIYVQSGDEIAKTPNIWVVFEVTSNEITIHDINVENFDSETD